MNVNGLKRNINLGYTERISKMDSIYIPCSECNFGTESHEEMVNHILSIHSHYTLEEAETYATLWEEDAFDRQEADNIYRAEFYKKYGVDPDDIDKDPS
jgi:hypothetical protein